MQTGSRDLEVQARNQALQLERIEQQMGRLRVVHENSIEESRKLFAEVQSLRRGMLAMAIVIGRAAPGYGGNGRLSCSSAPRYRRFQSGFPQLLMMTKIVLL